MGRYDHHAIEKKWQDRWAKEQAFRAPDFPGQKRKSYVLDMFPYPSSAGLHVGHPEGYTATDIYSRYLRLRGFDVMHPMGWDSFGLPAENFAIKSGLHPRETTSQSIRNFGRQIGSLGFSYDWAREVVTSDPAYYKWTQWLFGILYKKGLAYKKIAPVNWCPKDQTVLANEQVVDGACERCHTPVVQKELAQWFFKVTEYADELLQELDALDWPEPIKLMQRNWIGRSEGAEIRFPLAALKRRFVLLHGYKGSADGIFFPWLKKTLESQGHEVIAPELPHPAAPTEDEQVGFVLKNVHFDEQTVLLGHSLGAVVAMKVMERLKSPIARLVLVGGFSQPRFKDKSRPFHATFKWEFDFPAIAQKCRQIAVLSATNDSAIHIETGRELARDLGVTAVEVQAADDHFCGREEPTILAALNVAPTRFLLATNNPSKVARVKFLLQAALPDVEIVTPEQEGIPAQDIPEDNDLAGNATAKAKAYLGKTNLPILGMDTGLFLDGVQMDPVKVKRNALGGNDANDLSPEEVGRRMQDYYASLAREHGGEVAGYFLDALSLVLPDGSVRAATSKRDHVFYDKRQGKYDPHFPLRNLYRSKATGKIAAEQSQAEELTDLQPYTLALVELLQPSLRVFTTRPDTLFGVTYMVLAPEHPLVPSLTTGEHKKEIEAYVEGARKLKEIERASAEREKTGVFTGSYAVNPANEERIPIWVADYVLASYGTGAVMAVPAHDERDFAFAKKFKLPVSTVIRPPEVIPMPSSEAAISPGAWGHLGGDIEHGCWTGDGTLINSGTYDGLKSEQGGLKIVSDLARKGLAKQNVQYKLRDWLISRQRYWGAPIPIVYCDGHGEQLVPDKDLPVELPDDVDFRPTGESPLARSKTFMTGAKCPVCHKSARRETDTMDTFVDSSWYFLRYCDPKNDKKAFDQKKVAAWLPVDLYVGGAEHAVLHLLYSRFIYKALADAGELPEKVGREPFLKLRNQGLILGEDGEKMSKSRGNVVNPDQVVEEYGADAFRLFEMFLGPLEMVKPWSTKGIVGMRRFLERVWKISHLELSGEKPSDSELRIMHASIKKVTEDIGALKFNTAISQLMIFLGGLEELENPTKQSVVTLLNLLLPFTPHIASECLSHLEQGVVTTWPAVVEGWVQDPRVSITIQINGKHRGTIEVLRGTSQAEVEKIAKMEAGVQRHLIGSPRKVIFVQDRIINFVILPK